MSAIRSPPEELWIASRASFFAASKREGATSVDPMLALASITRTVTSPVRPRRLVWGRASAMVAASRASS
ncbi:hypothetical protein EON79_19905 [bacterium]|nr:MAG: hypothetical protein EON79_19905 [bacterium]